jgi:hypothetical protein
MPKTQQPNLSPISPKDAIGVLKRAFVVDSSYAWSWHCNLVMMAYDAGASHKSANERAAGFMRMVFDFDTSKNDEYKY